MQRATQNSISKLGVSAVLTGKRRTLGIIFHDAA